MGTASDIYGNTTSVDITTGSEWSGSNSYGDWCIKSSSKFFLP